ncbi:hypothetical protein CC1G_03764 [Coprinopsis cinerea okayama7|uniref:Membrane transporter n=1 Tax=Coprinopsis cinerea (strain Okayama-7 / 130 / ATCC MYA-4618 / FGSC 9003) TaxID=240176 RepID=A8N257_COPC7|nr:hypothetical protein CC1G_03764 [Coprinopsis cinerea okayama7\|eukprot:XP_001828970.2 hypothetical protein CC1G_03764 [Coprinopsis cinerea okayama7\
MSPNSKPPIGLAWRAGYWFTTLVVGCGIAIDLLVYSIIIPVVPFQLDKLGYENISSLAGWLLFAYSGGLLGGYRFSYCLDRRTGLAGRCDSRAESWPLVLGPPLGGALYTRFGFRGPFVFGIAASFLDLVGRFLIIERKDSIKWGFDPHYVKGEVDSVSDLPPSEKAGLPSVPTTVPPEPTNRGHGQETATAEGSETVESSGDTPKHKTLPLVTVIARLSKSSRALAASIIFTGLEPSLPVHLQRVWGLSSGGVGLVFIAAVVPGLISSPATGYISDKRGAEYVATACFFLAIPWTVVLMLEKGLALNIEGVGYGHVYAAYNLAYAVGSTNVR